MEDENARDRSVMDATLAAFDAGTRGRALVDFFFAELDKARSSAGLPKRDRHPLDFVLIMAASQGPRNQLQGSMRLVDFD